MNKQDRHGVRSPMDLERKYDFGLVFGDNPNSYLKMIEKVGKLMEETEELKLRLTEEVEELENKLAEEVETLEDKLSEVFPVGSLYVSLDYSNPSGALGGTWILFSSGHLVLGDGTTLSQSEAICYVWLRTA